MSLNKAILIGRLGQDPETRYLPSGEAVCSFSLATTESWKNQNGEKQERTEWHNITLFGKLAEIAAQYLGKGSQVYLEGKIRSEKYTDKQGTERTAYKIICHEMKMLGSKNDQPNTASGSPATPPKPPQYGAPQPPQQYYVPPEDDVDEDIPF